LNRKYFLRNPIKPKAVPKILTCNVCGHKFVKGKRPDGQTNGSCSVTADGRMTMTCADCLIKKGVFLDKGGAND
jgi:hypothetical protein